VSNPKPLDLPENLAHTLAFFSTVLLLLEKGFVTLAPLPYSFSNKKEKLEIVQVTS
jgi:hypothetical protein